MPDSPTPPWSELRGTLETRRNLERTLFPMEQIGSLASPLTWPSHAEFVRHQKEVRAVRRQWNRELLARLGLMSEEQVRAKIAELKNLEARLWSLCRPDLYPP